MKEEFPPNLPLFVGCFLIKKKTSTSFLAEQSIKKMVIAYEANLNEKKFHSSRTFPMNIQDGERAKGARNGFLWLLAVVLAFSTGWNECQIVRQNAEILVSIKCE